MKLKMDIKIFRQLHSELIGFCQFIEKDLKAIYCYMCEGDFDDTFDSLDKNSVGMVINKLKELDNSNGSPYFSNADIIF